MLWFAFLTSCWIFTGRLADQRLRCHALHVPLLICSLNKDDLSGVPAIARYSHSGDIDVCICVYVRARARLLASAHVILLPQTRTTYCVCVRARHGHNPADH